MSEPPTPDRGEPGCEIVGLFPIPFMRITAGIDQALVQACLEHVQSAVGERNTHSRELTHCAVADPATHPVYSRLVEAVVPALTEFGVLLFGERLDWRIKELWSNVLEPGGHQAIHAHANSFISGILYLTPSHDSARTVFHRSLGGTEYAFTNKHAGATTNQFNGDRWVSPPPAPGDIVLYPSYLLHEVPVNRGGRRVTIAFNAIPHRLKSWGYEIRFDAG